MLNQKGTIGQYILLILFMSAIIIGTTGYLASIPISYDVNATNWTNTTAASKAEEVANMSKLMKNRIEEVQITGIAEVDYIFMIAKGAVEAVKLSFASMDMMIAMISDLATSVGIIPGWFTNIVTAAAAIILVLLVLGALHKWELVKW